MAVQHVIPYLSGQGHSSVTLLLSLLGEPGSAGSFSLGPSCRGCRMAGALLLGGFPGLDVQDGFRHTSGTRGSLRVASLLLDEDMGFKRQETQASRSSKAVPSTGTVFCWSQWPPGFAQIPG